LFGGVELKMRIDRLMSTVWRRVDITERCVQTSINGHERALLRDERAQLLYGRFPTRVVSRPSANKNILIVQVAITSDEVSMKQRTAMTSVVVMLVAASGCASGRIADRLRTASCVPSSRRFRKRRSMRRYVNFVLNGCG
jgi:hypothetical protein